MASNYYIFDKKLKEGELLKDRFEIIKQIGGGGFGTVYNAYDNKNKGE